jgi:hypothetical protein
MRPAMLVLRIALNGFRPRQRGKSSRPRPSQRISSDVSAVSMLAGIFRAPNTGAKIRPIVRCRPACFSHDDVAFRADFCRV